MVPFSGSTSAYEAVLRRRLADGQPLNPTPAPPALTFAKFSSEWFETYVRTNNKPATQASRWTTLKVHLVPAFGALALSEIDVAKLERYKMAKLAEGLSARTINHHLSALSRCLHDAVTWGVLAVVPRLKLLRPAPWRSDFLSHQEADQLVAATAEGTWRTMATLALNTGLRIGEIFGLHWSDIDFTARQLVVRRSIVNGIVGTPKNNRERQVPLSAAAVAALATMPRDHQLVFHRGKGKPLIHATAGNHLRHACERARIRPIGWHVLRHTFASWLVADGVPLPVVQRLLGHANIEMTMRYSHMAPSSFRSAIDVLERRCNPAPVGYSWAPGGQQAPVLVPIATNSAASKTPISALN
jgi:integrase